MSVPQTLQALATRLATLDATLLTPTSRIYADPAEALSLGDFPALVLALAPGTTQTWRQEALGLARHDYTVALYVFVGARQTGLAELHSRVLPWPQALATVLVADLTLGGTVQWIGDGGDGLFTYDVGPYQWADGEYFGLKCQIPITEKIPLAMG